MGHDYAARLTRAARATVAAGLDALVLTPSADLVYLVGYDALLRERLTALIIGPGDATLLVVPELERPRAIESKAGKLVEMTIWRDGADPYEPVRRILPDGGRYGVSDRMWASHLIDLQRILPASSFFHASTVLSPLRMRKDEGEVELLRRAARSADEAFRQLLGQELEGRTEEEISRRLAGLLIEHGCESVAFSIVASGPNAASPHHESGYRTLRSGDVVVLDFGGRVGGYGSDVTRTVSLGEPSEELKEVHHIVREAQEAAVHAVRPGIAAQEVDRAARRVIEEAGYGEAFIHRAGHGIGLDGHEPPYIVTGNREPLEPGMCFSIEPGIYLEGRFGVRIEDIVSVTKDGVVRLNQASRDLLAVAS